jgi:hypothetical protein
MKMVRLSTLFLLAAVMFGQTAKDAANPPAPPDVDLALRTRITEFLNDHITGEFRKGEELVADDTKDIYYIRAKNRYISCSGIQSIKYSENFTHAYAVVLCTVPMSIGGDEGTPAEVSEGLTVPPLVAIPSTWKIDHGKWCWYLDKEMDRKWMFGTLPPITAGKGMAPGTVLPIVPMPPGVRAPVPPVPPGSAPDGTTRAEVLAAMKAATSRPVTAANLGPVPEEELHHVKLESSEISVKRGGQAKLKISNDSEDVRILMMLGQLPGIECKLETTNLEGGASTNVNFRAKEGAQSGMITLVVASTGEMMPIQVKVK